MNKTALKAKQIKSALKIAFPEIDFSVRSNSYTGGASIDISYSGDVTLDAVDAIIAPSREDYLFISVSRQLSTAHVTAFANYVASNCALHDSDGNEIVAFTPEILGGGNGDTSAYVSDEQDIVVGNESFRDYVMELARNFGTIEDYKATIKTTVAPTTTTPIDTIDFIDFLASAVNFYILSCKAFKQLEIEDAFHWNTSESEWYRIKIATAFCVITVSQMGAVTVHMLPEMNTQYAMSIDKAQRLGSDLQRAALIATDLQNTGEFSLGSESFSCSYGAYKCPF